MAGMTEEQYLSLFNQDISLDIRWKMFAPYWKKSGGHLILRQFLYLQKNPMDFLM